MSLDAFGSIVDDGSDMTYIIADTAGLTAGDDIGASGNELDTKVTTLNADAASGDIYVKEYEGNLVLDLVLAGGTVNVENTVGNIVVVEVTADTTATLTASAPLGDICDDSSNTTFIEADTAILYARNIGEPLNAIDTKVVSLDATANTGGSIYVKESDSDVLLNSVYAPGEVVIENTAGGMTIIVQG